MNARERVRPLAERMRGAKMFGGWAIVNLILLVASSIFLFRDFMTNYHAVVAGESLVNVDGSQLLVFLSRWAEAVIIQFTGWAALWTAMIMVPQTRGEARFRFLIIILAVVVPSYDVHLGFLHYLHDTVKSAGINPYDFSYWSHPVYGKLIKRAMFNSLVLDCFASELLSNWTIAVANYLRDDYREMWHDIRRGDWRAAFGENEVAARTAVQQSMGRTIRR